MSKLGRYSADRKKIEALTSDKTVEVADCGTIFTLAETSGFTSIILPKVADAGNGWWCRFVLASLTGGANVDMTIAQSSLDSNDLVNLVVLDGSGGHTTAIAADGVKFDTSACAVGDQVEIYTDGVRWYGQAMSSGSAALVAHDA